VRNKVINIIYRIVFLIAIYAFSQHYYTKNLNFTEDFEVIIGEASTTPANWVGSKDVDKNISILILAGHADSQGLAGAGTPGEAVDKYGLNPMHPEISDELFWNLKLQESIVKIGKQKGLNIRSYDPGIRYIDDANDPRTNWSVGRQFAKRGGYALEIHFDAYGKYGIGSGLIPPFSETPNKIDESIAKTFGRFPILFRGGLGAPRRQIRILEIGKLEGLLEKNLRNIKTRRKTINLLSNKIVQAILNGMVQKSNI
tara:strand:+ start:471 stop:1238 length:768 start_codon:yes stop_codon:yes gene_type:complete